MSTEILDFTNEDEFDFSPTEIVFSETGAVLAFTPAPGQFQQFYTNDVGFTYDNTKLEFVTGVVQQISQIPAQVGFGANYDSMLDANWGTGNLSPISTTGTPTATGKLDLIGNSVTYNNTGAMGASQGAIRFKYTPNYNGAPVTDIIFRYGNPSVLNGDLLILSHNLSGLTITSYTAAGVFIQNNVSFGAWSAVMGVEYEIELNWNYAGGAQHLFIDGIELGPGLAGVGSRSNVGGDIETTLGDFSGGSDFELNDLVMFKAQQHSSDYTPGYTVPDFEYFEASATLPDFVYTNISDISSYTSLVSDSGVNQQYIVNGLWWNGSAWVASNGSYAESSTEADLSSNFATFPTVMDTVSLVVVFPNSDILGSVSRTDFNYVAEAYRTSGKIVQNTFAPSSVLMTFSEVLSNKPVGTTLTYILSIQSVLKWWDGAAWVVSDGSLAQSNDASTVQNNLGTLSLNPAGENVSVVTWLSTTDNQVSPEVTTVEYQFTFDIPLIQPPSITVVYGIPIDISGNIANEARLTVEYKGPPIPYITGSQTAMAGKVSADARPEDGAVILELISSELYGGQYLFKMSYISSVTNCRKTETWGWTTIPPQAAINFVDLTFTPEPV